MVKLRLTPILPSSNCVGNIPQATNKGQWGLGVRVSEFSGSDFPSHCQEFFNDKNSGKMTGMDETWSGISNALRVTGRGLPGGSSLAKLLATHRGSIERVS